MRGRGIRLEDCLTPQIKSKIKAGDGAADGRYKFFTSSPIQDKYYDRADYHVPALIFGTGGNASVHYCAEPFSTSTDCVVMYGKNGANLEVIYQYLKMNIHVLEEGFRGAGLKHISKNYILNICVNLPDEQKQEKLVNLVQQLDNIIQLREQQLKNFDTLVKARFIELFGDPVLNTMGWEEKALSVLGKVGSSKRIYQEELVTEGIPFFRVADLTGLIDEERIEPNLYISHEKYDELKQGGHVPTTGDLLVTSRGTLGKCYIIKETDRFYFQDGMITWVHDMDDKLNALYLYHLFSMEGFRLQLTKTQSGSTVSYLSIEMIKNLRVMLPPLSLQKDFSTFVSHIESLKSPIRASLSELTTLKKSLLQEYFT